MSYESRVHQVGFEPTRLAPAELESASLDHSDTDALLQPRIELGLAARSHETWFHKTTVLTDYTTGASSFFCARVPLHIYRPVEPKPSAPRVVSSGAATSTTSA